MAGVHCFDDVSGSIQPDQESGHVAMPGLGAFTVVQKIHAGRDFDQRQVGVDHGAKRGAERHAHQSGSEALAGDVSHHDNGLARRPADQIEVVAANLVASHGAGSQLVAGDLRHLLRNQAALHHAGGVQIALDALPLHGPLVEAGVLNGNGSLHGERFQKVGFVQIQGAAGRKENHEVRKTNAALVAEGKTKPGFAGGIRAAGSRVVAQQLSQMRGDVAVGVFEGGKERTGQLKLAHDNLERDIQHLVEPYGRVNLPACFQQRLQPRDLLLGDEGFTEFH